MSDPVTRPARPTTTTTPTAREIRTERAMVVAVPGVEFGMRAKRGGES